VAIDDAARPRPKPDIVAEAQRMFADNVAPGDFVVGVQMRTQKRTRLHPPVRCCSVAELASRTDGSLSPHPSCAWFGSSSNPLKPQPGATFCVAEATPGKHEQRTSPSSGEASLVHDDVNKGRSSR